MKPWKVQKFFGDVVYDLRNRRLLPVAILLIVGMIAVPVLISKGGSGSSSSALQATAAPVRPDPHSQSAVVSYTPPGLRNYKQRLSDQAPKDPFRQQFNNAAAAAAASQLTSTVTSPTTTGAPSTSASSPGTTVGGGTSGGSIPAKPRIVYYHSVADLSFGSTDQAPTRHKKIEAFTSLPNQTAPVVIYLGSSLDGKRAFFSVSTYDSQLTGPGVCAPGPTDCSLLVLAPGQAETMVYSGDGKTYALTINKINRVVSKKPPAG
jgi:hypothetical protein